MEIQYMTLSNRRAGAAIQRLLRTQKDNESPISPIIMFNGWVAVNSTNT
jgi:hypothetical protein